MRNAQQGITIIEALGALAIATVLLVGLSSMVNSALDEVKGQQAALYQEQVTNAASKYITANYADLVAATAGGATATVTLAQLKTSNFLSAVFSDTNNFGQTPCALVRQNAPGKLDTLVATHGGMPIPDRDIPLVAMLAGQGGGYISAAAPAIARGASWQMDTTPYRNVPCGGTTVLDGSSAKDGGHLVSSLFYDGPGQLATDFLHRNVVPGRPELNQMNTPIHMVPGTGAQAVEGDATDPRCTAASGTGKIAVDAAGQVLSCQAGVWKRQGAGFWKDPVTGYADLPASDNTTGDVRMVTALNRAFTWNGSSWTALAVDQNGNFLMPGMLTANLMKLNEIVVKNEPCSDNGMIARDASGLILSCQSGRWRNTQELRLANLVYDKAWTVRVGDGTPMDIWLDIASLPGSRPLYLTGYANCRATGFPRAYAYINMVNAEGVNEVYTGNYVYTGGCMSRPLNNTVGGVLNKGFIGLQEIPEEAVQLHFHLEVQEGSAPEDYIELAVKIYSSE